MLNDWELRKLAHYIAMELMDGKQPEPKPMKRLLSAKEAAQVLGISRSQMYKISGSFSTIKCGKNNSRIKFNSMTLEDEYEKFIQSIHN